MSLDPSDEHADKSTRVKEKQLKVSANMSSHDMEIAATRVEKWLSKGLYVRITVSHSKKNQKGADEVVARIRDRSKEVLQQDKEHLLNIKHI